MNHSFICRLHDNYSLVSVAIRRNSAWVSIFPLAIQFLSLFYPSYSTKSTIRINAKMVRVTHQRKFFILGEHCESRLILQLYYERRLVFSTLNLVNDLSKLSFYPGKGFFSLDSTNSAALLFLFNLSHIFFSVASFPTEPPRGHGNEFWGLVLWIGKIKST